MPRPAALAALLALAAAPPTLAADPRPWDAAKKVAGQATTGKLEQEINKRLLEEGRQSQCSFVTDKAVLEKGCDAKLKRLANALISAKQRLASAGVKSFVFEVSGHTDSSGSAKRNDELSAERAEVIAKELVARGVPRDEIRSVGMGSRKPVVKPDDTPAKKAMNRRYEVQVRL